MKYRYGKNKAKCVKKLLKLYLAGRSSLFPFQFDKIFIQIKTGQF